MTLNGPTRFTIQIKWYMYLRAGEIGFLAEQAPIADIFQDHPPYDYLQTVLQRPRKHDFPDEQLCIAAL